MTFRPANPDHSIAWTVFGVVLSRSISSASINAFFAGDPQLLKLLPAQSIVTAEELISDPMIQMANPRTPQGYVAGYLKPDGEPVWQLAVFHNQVEVRASRYTRWNTMWDTAKEMLLAALAIIARAEKGDMLLDAITHRVTDKFYADKGYKLDQLLKRDRVLPEHLFTHGGDYWHTNTGWFEPEGGKLTLSRLTVGAQGRQAEQDVEVAIDLSEMRIFPPDAPTARSKLTDDLAPVLEAAMTELHGRNKMFMQRVLQPEVLDAIGLGTTK